MLTWGCSAFSPAAAATAVAGFSLPFLFQTRALAWRLLSHINLVFLIFLDATLRLYIFGCVCVCRSVGWRQQQQQQSRTAPRNKEHRSVHTLHTSTLEKN